MLRRELLRRLLTLFAGELEKLGLTNLELKQQKMEKYKKKLENCFLILYNVSQMGSSNRWAESRLD